MMSGLQDDNMRKHIITRLVSTMQMNGSGLEEGPMRVYGIGVMEANGRCHNNNGDQGFPSTNPVLTVFL